MIAYVGNFFDPLESIGMEIQNIQSAVAGVRRIDEFLKETEEIREREVVVEKEDETKQGKDAAVRILERTERWLSETKIRFTAVPRRSDLHLKVRRWRWECRQRSEQYPMSGLTSGESGCR